jgi:hypothetical protein
MQHINAQYRHKTVGETWEYEFTRLQSKPTNSIPYIDLVHNGAEDPGRVLHNWNCYA